MIGSGSVTPPAGTPAVRQEDRTSAGARNLLAQFSGQRALTPLLTPSLPQVNPVTPVFPGASSQERGQQQGSVPCVGSSMCSGTPPPARPPPGLRTQSAPPAHRDLVPMGPQPSREDEASGQRACASGVPSERGQANSEHSFAAFGVDVALGAHGSSTPSLHSQADCEANAFSMLTRNWNGTSNVAGQTSSNSGHSGPSADPPGDGGGQGSAGGERDGASNGAALRGPRLRRSRRTTKRRRRR